MSFRKLLVGATVAITAFSISAIAQETQQDDPLSDLFDEAQTQQTPTEPPEAGEEDPLNEFIDPAEGINPETGEFEEGFDGPENTGPRLAPIFSPEYDPEDYMPSAVDPDMDNNDPFDGVVDEDAEDGEEVGSEGEESEGELPDLEYLPQPAVMLRGLDKISGRSNDLEVAVDSTILFGGLRVSVKACHQTPPTEAPESVAYIEIEDFGFELEDMDELPEGIDMEKRVFNGWMFASTPGLNALEHAIYDVWVIRCMAEAPVLSEDGSES
ncbi:MAG: hypothetical protein CMK07_13290 [Ponticaulis sp.]|nr:hypothetical protein [Ponticaulis sp.]